MAFTIEFQPQGFRLKCDRPINALDAALQAGIHLNAVCGGEGICGKCVIQILSDSINFPISKKNSNEVSEIRPTSYAILIVGGLKMLKEWEAIGQHKS